MLLRVKHHTSYSYSKEVFLEPQRLYFYPSLRPNITIKNVSIHITPEPSGFSKRIDAENNVFFQTWYNNTLTTLEIEVIVEVDVEDTNPFNYLEMDKNPEGVVEYLSIYSQSILKKGSPVLELIKPYQSEITTETQFVTEIIQNVSDKIDHSIRYEPTLLTPEECLESARGSCRDVSWLVMNILRYYQIPARFVSGYGFNPELEGHELHAWVEYWNKGAGWIGIDPSTGLYVNENYIPLAASYKPSLTLPVQGTFRGKANSELNTDVVIERIDNI